jgi:NhaA family Na+:H+ antiporter
MSSVDVLDRPRGSKVPIQQLLLPFQEFIHKEASSGILLIVFTVIALVWANSPWADSYHNLWQIKLNISLGDFFKLNKPLLLWINDGLMAIFFFVVGLEIKREFLVGELKSARQAALPIAAAFGGMVVPALLYTMFNAGGAGAAGWGIPMATDIAFALGILALLGNRVPLALKIFLTALAIVDDIGAVLVIAVFYTAQISWISLLIGFVFLGLMVAANWAGVRHPLLYAALGLVLWVAFLKSGVHATVAGVLGAMAIPARTRINADSFLECGRYYLEKFGEASVHGHSVLTNRRQRAAIQAIEEACEQAQSPMQRLEHGLHPWVAFAVVPVFALANAGVSLQGDFFAALLNPVTLGIMVGLVLGKQIGVTLFSWLVVKVGLAELPAGVTWVQLYGVSWLAGIGFTMSIFIANLAFGEGEELAMAKVGILLASLIAGAVGWVFLRLLKPAKAAG